METPRPVLEPIDVLLKQARGAGADAREAFPKIAAWRREMAATVLSFDTEQQLVWAAGEAGRFIHSPLPWDAAAEDYLLAEKILEQWTDPVPNVRSIVAAMMLAPAHHWPAPPALKALPPWLRKQYALYLLRAPVMFIHSGEADRFAAHLTAAFEALHRAVIHDRLPEAHELALPAATDTKIMSYFNEQNLRPLFRFRAEIAEWLQVTSGHRLEHLPSLTGRSIPRVGLLHAATSRTEEFYLFAHLIGRPAGSLEVILYWFAPSTPPAALVSLVDRVVSLPNDVTEAVSLIRDGDIDLLLATNNLTCGLTQIEGIAAHRLARVQVVGSASPVTPGFSNFDLYLSGELNERSPTAQDQYEEKLALLPGSVNYYAFGRDTEAATISCSRAHIGLRSDQIVFFSAANYFKTGPEVTAAWAEILAQVPNSVLLLMPFNPNWGSDYPQAYFAQRLNHDAIRHGVSPARILIVDPMRTRADVHAIMSVADIYLDSFPFAGACSLVDPLQVGLPIVACDGKTFRSTVAAAVLREQGLGDMVSPDIGEYVRRAASLAKDAAFRKAERERVAQAASSGPRCLSTEQYAQNFAEFCRKAVGAYAEHVKHLRSTMPDELRLLASDTAEKLARARSFPFARLTDLQIIRNLIIPYVRTLSLEERASGRMIDIGACIGEASLPFLQLGHDVEMFEPDPECAPHLAKICQAFAGRATHHAAAIVTGTAGTVTFRKRSMGLSGLAESPFSAAETEIAVPARSFADVVRDFGERVDVIKIDAEGLDLELLNTVDFGSFGPKLVMVEFGLHFPKQGTQEIHQTLFRMAAAGYAAVIFENRKCEGFGATNWDCELAALSFEPDGAIGRGDKFGNIVFFRQEDATFLACLVSLLETFLPARQRPVFTKGDPDRPWRVALAT